VDCGAGSVHQDSKSIVDVFTRLVVRIHWMHELSSQFSGSIRTCKIRKTVKSIVTNVTIAEKQFGKHVPAATGKQKKQNNRGNVRHCDLYSVLPEVVVRHSSFTRKLNVPEPVIFVIQTPHT
jgi:hypothetical protein